MPETVIADKGVGGCGVGSCFRVWRFLSFSWWRGVGLRGVVVVVSLRLSWFLMGLLGRVSILYFMFRGAGVEGKLAYREIFDILRIYEYVH
jgi:hypothetical protein